MEVVLVSQTKVKAFTSLNPNLDDELLNSQIVAAQKIGLQQLLGSKFLEFIKTQVKTNTITSEIQVLLDDYISDYLINRAYFECLPFIYTRAVSQGLVRGLSEEGQPAAIQDLKFLRSIAQERYQFFAQRLNDYLCENSSLYPTYNSQTTKDGLLPDKNQNYYGGIVIPSYVKKGRPGKGTLPEWDEPYNGK